MLQNTFCHVPGIGLSTEQKLWASGIHSWEILRDANPERVPLTKGKIRTLQHHIEESLVHLGKNDARYFAQMLPPKQEWRFFPNFRQSTAYLDIETTGMGNPGDHITTIALYDGKAIFHYIWKQNLDQFKKDIQKYEVVVTYNGKCFDLPFIHNTLGIHMDQAHIDLRYLLKSLGYGGGLKGCEKRLGIDRQELDGVDGFFAVLLWNDYKKNKNGKALETLLAYNIEDVVNLERLMVLAYNMKLAETPFLQTHTLSLPSQPEIPFKADMKTIRKIRDRMYP